MVDVLTGTQCRSWCCMVFVRSFKVCSLSRVPRTAGMSSRPSSNCRGDCFWFLVCLDVDLLQCFLTFLLGRQEEHPACRNWVTGCWCGYLYGARRRLFAYGPADATAIPKPRNLLPHINPDWFLYFWYRLTLTQVVLENRPLNGCSNSSSLELESRPLEWRSAGTGLCSYRVRGVDGIKNQSI